jgi:hypothetical protein
MGHDSTTPATGTRSIWVSLREISARCADVLRNLHELERRVTEAKLHGADILYSPDTDTALLRLRLDDDRVTDTFVAELRRCVARFDASVIDIGHLEPQVRKRFAERFRRPHTVRFPAAATSREALEVLARHLRKASQSEQPQAEETAPPAALRVRFRRGEQWQLGRVRSISPNSVSVATGCPPRKDDTVEIEVSFAGLTLTTPALVVAVTPPETAALLGAYGFGARFVRANERTRALLKRITAIADDDPTLTTRPPSRRHVRYPVRWPVAIGMGDDSARFAALDISESGLFIASNDFVCRGTPTGVAIPLERGDREIRAGGRVTRTLDERMAGSQKTPAGFGLELTSMSETDASLFRQLVQRVGHRSARHVFVGAAPERVGRLIDSLAAVGYAASGTSLGADIVGQATTRSPPDLVIVDQSLDDPCLANEKLFSAHPNGATFVAFGGKAYEVWALADAMLP